jgi:hypothetical protein
MRQAFISFDLMGGLTEQDLDNMTLTSRRFATFFFLLACLWLVLGLKSSGLASRPRHPGCGNRRSFMSKD